MVESEKQDFCGGQHLLLFLKFDRSTQKLFRSDKDLKVRLEKRL